MSCGIKHLKIKMNGPAQIDSIDFQPFRGTHRARYYYEIAINNALDAIADKQQRILLTLAAGTDETVIAFHIAWKLFPKRVGIYKECGQELPRILF